MKDIFAQKFKLNGPKYRFLTLPEIREIVGYECTIRSVCESLSTDYINGGFLCPAESLNYLERPHSTFENITDRLEKTYDTSGKYSLRPLHVVSSDINFPLAPNMSIIRAINSFAKNSKILKTESGHVFLLPPPKHPERWVQNLAARAFSIYKTTVREVSLHELVIALGGSFDSALDMIRVRSMVDGVGSFKHDDDYERIRFPWVG